ncbi:hypothetical protein EV715DRAFT_204956 [Schizophyllum commune]
MSWPPKPLFLHPVVWPLPLVRPGEMSASQPPPLQRGGHLVDLPPLTPGLVNCDTRLSESAAVEQQANLFGDAISFRSSTKTSAEPDTSSINRLPFEILSDIFILSLPPVDHSWMFGETIDAYEGGCYPDIPSHLRAPVVLTAVCTYWHAVATGTPRLWTRILVDDLCARRQLHWAALHVKNSGNLPLILHIRTNPGDPHQALNALLRIIVPHAQRWHTLVLFGYSFRLDDARFLSTARAESLTSIMIHDVRSNVRDIIWSWAMSMPFLRRVTLTLANNNIPTLMSQASNVWMELRDLSLSDRQCQTPEVLTLLQTCPRMEILHVDSFSWPRLWDDADLPVTQVQAPNLHTLLVVNHADDTHIFFAHVLVPRLRHLAIDDHARHANSHSQTQLWSTVTDMLARSGARLKRFLYTGDEEQLVELLQRDTFQDLKELSAYRMLTSKRLLNMLTIHAGHCCLPFLDDLSIGCTWGATEAALDKMIMSRKGSLHILQFWCLIYPIDLTVLKRASADWLAVYFVETPYEWNSSSTSS